MMRKGEKLTKAEMDMIAIMKHRAGNTESWFVPILWFGIPIVLIIIAWALV